MSERGLIKKFKNHYIFIYDYIFLRISLYYYYYAREKEEKVVQNDDVDNVFPRLLKLFLHTIINILIEEKIEFRLQLWACDCNCNEIHRDQQHVYKWYSTFLSPAQILNLLQSSIIRHCACNIFISLENYYRHYLLSMLHVFIINSVRIWTLKYLNSTTLKL